MNRLYFLFLISVLGLTTNLFGQEIVNDTAIFTVVPNMPTFGQNKEDLQLFIKKTSKIPTMLKRTDKNKKVAYARVIIEKDGKAKFDKIIKSIGGEFLSDVQYVIEKMPNWTPGTMNDGTKVRVYYIFPFWFE